VRSGELHRIERFTACGQVASRLGIINSRQASLTEAGRILNNFVAFSVALVILISRGAQGFKTRIGSANLNHRTITYCRLRRCDGRLLLTIVTCTGCQ